MNSAPISAQWVCDTCGSPKVQVQVWFDPNTEEAIDDTGGDAWCEACDDHCVVTIQGLAKSKSRKANPE